MVDIVGRFFFKIILFVSISTSFRMFSLLSMDTDAYAGLFFPMHCLCLKSGQTPCSRDESHIFDSWINKAGYGIWIEVALPLDG